MKPILTLEDFEAELCRKYQCKDKNIIALMLAPYNLKPVKEVVDQYYHTWHLLSGADLDVFWMGYGEMQGKSKYTMKLDLVEGNWEQLYFQLDAFLTGTKAMNTRCHFTYHESFELILFNYERSHVDYYNHIRIDLQADSIQEKDIHELMHMLITYTQAGKSIHQLKNGYKKYRSVQRIKKVKLSEFLGYIRSFTNIIG